MRVVSAPCSFEVGSDDDMQSFWQCRGCEGSFLVQVGASFVRVVAAPCVMRICRVFGSFRQSVDLKRRVFFAENDFDIKPKSWKKASKKLPN